MRKSLFVLMAATVATLSGSAYAAPRGDPEAQLAQMVAGRTAGSPVDCLRLNDIRSSRIINRTAIVYEGQNGTLYVNRPSSGAAFLRDGLTLVTDTHTDQLCGIDTVQLMDMSARMPSGSVGLGQFVPYPRPPRANAH